MGLLENSIGAMIGSRMGGGGGGGSSLGSGASVYAPMATALIGLLAAKAATGGFGDLGSMFGGGNKAPQAKPQGQGQVQGQPQQQSGAGGLLGGLGGLFSQFQQSGHGDLMNSWVGTGPNAPAQPQQISQALGPDTLRDLSQRLGLPESEVAARLSQELPEVVDKLTPQGRMPTHEEVSAWR